MRKFLGFLLLLSIASVPSFGQTNSQNLPALTVSGNLNLGSSGIVTNRYPNASAGTATGSLVKIIDTAGTAQVTKTAVTDTNNAFGCIQSGAGTSGNPLVGYIGIQNCLFDNVATTDGDFVIVSTAVAGTVSDAGVVIPTGVLNLGKVLSTHAACGAAPCGPYAVQLMTPDALGAAGTGIVATPSATQTIQPSTDATGLIVKQRNGTNTVDTFSIQDKSANKLLQVNSANYVAVRGPEMDCTLFAGADMSVKIQACTAALSAITTLYGIADARGFVGAQTWSVNPLGGTHPNGGILLLGGVAISQNVPFVKPANWTLQGPQGQNNTPGFHGATITASGSFQATYNTGTVTVTGTAVTGSGTTWPSGANSPMIGCNFAAGTAITAGTTSSWGVITAVGSTTGLTLGYQGAGNSSAGTAYAIYCPQAQFGNGATGNNEQSGGLDHVDFDCNSVAGCINVGEYFGEEGGFIKNVIMRGTTNIGLDMESSFIQNFGPIEDIGFSCGAGATSATLMAVIRGAAGSARPLRGFSGQCSAAAIGFDVGEWGAILEDMHFENTTIAIEVAGKPACPVACFVPDNSAANASFKNIWGAGTGTTLIHLSNTIGESNIVLENIGLPSGSGYTNTLVDSGNSCTATSHIGLYSVNNAGKIGYSTIASPLTCFPNGGVPTLLTCGTTTTCANSIINATTTRIITGRVTLSVGTATVTGISPVFASSVSMKCWASDSTALAVARAIPASTSSVTVTGTGADVIDWGCAGD